LESSGSHYFAALLGDTGAALASSRKSARNEEVGTQTSLYLDSDPGIFEDVLYFMRRGKIQAKTKHNVERLEDLKTEAEFFAYDALLSACTSCLVAIEKTVLDSLAPVQEPKARAHALFVQDGDSQTIDVAEGEVVFIVSATLAGECRLRRYTRAEGDARADIPGCYIDSPSDSDGDFQLWAAFDEEYTRTCLAHVGLDHVHVGDTNPCNYNFRQDLRICLSPDDDGEGLLGADGHGEWHVVYRVGRPEAIPYLASEKVQKENSQIKLEAIASQPNGEEEIFSTLSKAIVLGLLSG